jgi:hypothetical protein
LEAESPKRLFAAFIGGIRDFSVFRIDSVALEREFPKLLARITGGG